MSNEEPAGMTRRDLLAAGVAGTACLGESSRAEGAGNDASIYEELGVAPIINAAGTITMLGGSLMPPEVLAAWQAAARQFVSLPELQDRVGEAIARLLQVEAALVTTGAAGAILLGTAATLTYRERSRVARLPLPADEGWEVIRQRSHRQCYDQQVLACGVKLVDVTTREDLERAIHERTALMFAYNVNMPDGQISHEEWVAVARRRGIPTLLDAAADTPPVENLWYYNRLGYDLVAFSGGKGLRGPQDAGLLLGRRDLIEAAKWNASPYCGNIGRPLKVSKEDLVAMWAAVRRFVALDHAAERKEYERRLEVIERALAGIPTLTTRRIVPPIANQVPHLLLNWDHQKLSLTPPQLKERLAAGRPSIATARVHGTGDQGFLIAVWTLQTGEEHVVAARLREILTTPGGQT